MVLQPLYNRGYKRTSTRAAGLPSCWPLEAAAEGAEGSGDEEAGASGTEGGAEGDEAAAADDAGLSQSEVG